MEDRATMVDLARRALRHFENRTTDQAAAPMSMPVDAYVDPERYAAERERIFKHLPIALALSLELREPGDYKAMRVLDTPILMVRGADGRVRAFLNVCRHRGAPVCRTGTGNARVFTCPYHAWVYDQQGQLTGRYGEVSFGEVDAQTRGLIEFDCAERCGLIWVILTPGESFEIDAWLGEFAAELDSLELDNWHLFEQRDLPGPGWKITMDGYLESYHHPFVHPQTVGVHTVGNLLVLDTFGPHQRLTFGRKSLGELSGVAEADWAPGEHIRLIHSCFPNLSISGILGDHCLVSQIFPGPTPDTTITTQTILVAQKPETEAARQASRAFCDLTLTAVRDEDYAIGRSIQDAVGVLSGESFLFGRNEPAVQNYHNWVARFMQASGEPNTTPLARTNKGGR